MCNTVGCPAPSPASPDEVFCRRCGWPLGRARVQTDSSELIVTEHATPTLTARVENVGQGTLHWWFGDLPGGMTPQDAPKPVREGESQAVRLSIDRASLEPGQVEVRVPFEACTKSGSGPDDFREFWFDECWRDFDVAATIVRPRIGPLEMPWRTILFSDSIPEVTLNARNAGETPLDIEVSVSGGYTACPFGGAASSRVAVALPPGEPQTITIACPELAAGQSGEVAFESRDLGDRRWATAGIEWVDTPDAAMPEQRYVVAVDLGTSKTAAAVLDQRVRGAEPKLLMWDRPGADAVAWMPTRVAFGDGDQPISCGHLAPIGGPKGDVMDRLKMRMTDRDPRTRAGIAYILRNVFDQIAHGYGWDIFENATCVFSVPALDMGREYEHRIEVYRELIAVAGAPYGIDASAVQFVPEPECAAVEHLHRMQVDTEGYFSNFAIAEDDWICVFDIGAGTTDVAFAQVTIGDDGSLGFANVASLGYTVAGNYVDARLLTWCLMQWRDNGVLEDPGSRERPEVTVAGETWSRAELLEQIRVLKEVLYTPDPGGRSPERVDLDMFITAKLKLTRRVVTQRILPMCHALYRQGGDAIGRSIGGPPLGNWLIDEGGNRRLVPARVAAIFLSGGTSNVPDFGDQLRDLVLRSAEIRRLDEPRLHVVRGAARRPAVRAQHRAIGDFTARWGDGEPPTNLLERGAVPQACEPLVSSVVMPRRSVEFILGARIDGRSMDLYAREIHNASDEPRSAEVRVEYATGGGIWISIAWLVEPRELIVDRELVQIMPTL